MTIWAGLTVNGLKIGTATYSLLYYVMESLLSAGRPFIVESNFKPEFENEKFLNLKNKYGFEPFQILCKTNGEILFERFKARAESGIRHPGHVDHLNYEEFKEPLLKGRLENLNIGGKVFDIDTTDFNTIDYNALFSVIKSATNGYNTEYEVRKICVIRLIRSANFSHLNFALFFY